MNTSARTHATRNGQPAYLQAPPRLRQSDIDAKKAWRLSELHMMKGINNGTR